MNHPSLSHYLLVALLAAFGQGCGVEPNPDFNGDDPKECTDPTRCCPEEMLRCTGDPDTGIVCTCDELWVCSKDPSKCKQDAPTPPGGEPPAQNPPPGEPPPQNPTSPPVSPKAGQECVPGQKKWCDGEIYCGWGQVVCTPGGTWKRNPGGELDCKELADGRVPNTKCACYHFFFDEECCETPDCILPAGTDGQICPKSPGKLCDYCNPNNPECQPGGLCIVELSETFCGRDCSAAKPCPAGYVCIKLFHKMKFISQCLPMDGSCYE